MQKVTYINAYGESVEFSGKPPVLLRSVSGFSRPDGVIVSTQGAYQAGAVLQRIRIPARTVQVQFDLLSQDTRTQLYEQRMRIERVLAAGRCLRDGEMGTLVYENDAGRWKTKAVPDGATTYGKRFRNGMASNRISFICPSPYLLSGDAESVQMRMGGGGLTLPTQLPIRLGSRKFGATLRNNGSADAPLTVTIHGTGETPTLINRTTGAKLVVSRTIASGEKLVVKTDPMELSCVIIHADGTQEDAFGYLDPSIAVSAFVLIPGSNELEYLPSEASAGSYVDVEWHGYYEGV